MLTLALGIAVGSAAVFGVSMALGAFLAGLVVGRSDYSLRAASEALPMRDAFAVLFFVAVGMLLSPRLPARSARPDPGDARGRDDRQAAGRAGHRAAARLSLQGRARRSPSRSRRSASSRSSCRVSAASWASCRPKPRNTLVAASIVSIVLNPILYRAGAACRQMGRRVAASVEVAEPAASGRRRTSAASRRAGSEQARDRRRLRPDRPDGRPAAPRQRHRTGRDRAQHGYGRGSCATKASTPSTAMRPNGTRSRPPARRTRAR